ncbi:protein Mdm4 [Polypterus senegalus]|uniref:protein Mdm4 n=1 Tax=Polypterus senegalus TaxID=55291 RepID=UPI001965BA2C|nr:protein Mdm4 [Polypterus senegalus]
MTTESTSKEYEASSQACRILPTEASHVQPKASLLKILRAAGAKEDIFTLKEVMHYLGQYIMLKQLYDQQKQHLVHCDDDPLGDLLEVESFSVKNPSPIYEMLKKNLTVLSFTDAAKTLSVAKDSNHEATSEDPGQRGSQIFVDTSAHLTSAEIIPQQVISQRRCRESDGGSHDGQHESQRKRPKIDVSLEEWDLSGLPWWFLGNLHYSYSQKSNGSTDLQTNQDEATVIVSDATDDLCFLNDKEYDPNDKQVKDKQLAKDEIEEDVGKEEESIFENDVQDDTQYFNTDKEQFTEDSWQCTECHMRNSSVQRYCVRCWALQKNWFKDCPRLLRAVSIPDIPVRKDEDCGIDIPDCRRTVSDPIVLPSRISHKPEGLHTEPPDSSLSLSQTLLGDSFSLDMIDGTEGDSQDLLELDQGYKDRREAILEPCSLCSARPRNGNIIHGRTSHLITCFPCAKKLHKSRNPCPGCGQTIQKVIKTFIA